MTTVTVEGVCDLRVLILDVRRLLCLVRRFRFLSVAYVTARILRLDILNVRLILPYSLRVSNVRRVQCHVN